MAEIVHITLPVQFIGIAQGGETDPRSKRREKRLCFTDVHTSATGADLAQRGSLFPEHHE